MWGLPTNTQGHNWPCNKNKVIVVVNSRTRIMPSLLFDGLANCTLGCWFVGQDVIGLMCKSLVISKLDGPFTWILAMFGYLWQNEHFPSKLENIIKKGNSNIGKWVQASVWIYFLLLYRFMIICMHTLAEYFSWTFKYLKCHTYPFSSYSMSFKVSTKSKNETFQINTKMI